MEQLEIWAAREGAKGIMKAAGKLLQRLEGMRQLEFSALEYQAWKLFGEAVIGDAETIVRLADDEMGHAREIERERSEQEEARLEERVQQELKRREINEAAVLEQGGLCGTGVCGGWEGDTHNSLKCETAAIARAGRPPG